jgi:hypothetical protein
MTTPTLPDQNLAIRSRFASADLRTARARGELLIAGTACGNVALRYDAATQLFELCTLGLVSKVLARGTRREVQGAVVSLYVVEVQS